MVTISCCGWRCCCATFRGCRCCCATCAAGILAWPEAALGFAEPACAAPLFLSPSPKLLFFLPLQILGEGHLCSVWHWWLRRFFLLQQPKFSLIPAHLSFCLPSVWGGIILFPTQTMHSYKGHPSKIPIDLQMPMDWNQLWSHKMGPIQITPVWSTNGQLLVWVDRLGF